MANKVWSKQMPRATGLIENLSLLGKRGKKVKVPKIQANLFLIVLDNY